LGRGDFRRDCHFASVWRGDFCRDCHFENFFYGYFAGCGGVGGLGRDDSRGGGRFVSVRRHGYSFCCRFAKAGGCDFSRGRGLLYKITPMGMKVNRRVKKSLFFFARDLRIIYISSGLGLRGGDRPTYKRRIAVSKKTSILTGAVAAGVIAMAAVTGCQSPNGPEQKNEPDKPGTTVTNPADTTKTVTKPDTTATKPDTAQWKPLCMLYVNGAADITTNKDVSVPVGWATLYSEDGTWNGRGPAGQTRIELHLGEVTSERMYRFKTDICEKGGAFYAGQLQYWTDGSKGCRPVDF